MREVESTIGLLIVRVAKAHRNCAQTALSNLGLFPVQELILLQLWEQEGLTQTQIAERLGIEPPTVTKMLQRLERSDLVKRAPDTEDARISRVYLTPKSNMFEAEVRGMWRELEARTLAGLSDTEQIVLRRLLQHVQNNLDDC